MFKMRTVLAALFVIALSAQTASAALITFNNRATFEAQGTIAFNYGFEDVALNASGFFSAPNPWSTNGVQYTTGDNLVVGPAAVYAPTSNVFTFNGWTPVTGNILDPATNMFGFDLGVGGSTAPISITINTNLAQYDFLNQVVPNASAGATFFGFVSTAGEFITSFVLSSPGTGSFPALDNVTVGQVPEPTTLTLLGLGVASLGYRWRARRRQRA